ncbi:hypothetical protein M3Y97_00083800 [Aphelenchoides bicaudatus]|nr:hypothetical protein M3Y97_00083800 [Aphelenchoides bicaudatus]
MLGPTEPPCIHAAFESMNPLEAIEHQGGLQLSVPPFSIETKQKCYWVNQPVELTLQGNTTKDQFKGFAIQPFIYEGPNAGRRIGQFLRLDDNGSWQNQCFQKRDSVTHSHDERKKKITLWWKNDQNDDVTVQFVGTVVIALRQFWVKSVLSVPIPPCKQRQEISNWQHPAITVPPPVGQFKINTFHMFNQQNSNFLASSFANERQPVPVARPAPITPQPVFVAPQPQPTFTAPPPVQTTPMQLPTRTPITSFRQNPFVPQQFRPVPQQSRPIQPQQVPQQRQRLTHIIPLPNMETNARPRQQQFNRRPFLVNSATPSFNTPQTNQNQQCLDREPMNRCVSWIQFCRTSTFMQTSCRRSCRLC